TQKTTNGSCSIWKTTSSSRSHCLKIITVRPPTTRKMTRNDIKTSCGSFSATRFLMCMGLKVSVDFVIQCMFHHHIHGDDVLSIFHAIYRCLLDSIIVNLRLSEVVDILSFVIVLFDEYIDGEPIFPMIIQNIPYLFGNQSAVASCKPTQSMLIEELIFIFYCLFDFIVFVICVEIVARLMLMLITVHLGRFVLVPVQQTAYIFPAILTVQ